MVLALEKFSSGRFSLDVGGAFKVKLCLEMPLGALDYVPQLYDKLGEFWTQKPPPRRSNAAPRRWMCRKGMLYAQGAPGRWESTTEAVAAQFEIKAREASFSLHHFSFPSFFLLPSPLFHLKSPHY